MATKTDIKKQVRGTKHFANSSGVTYVGIDIAASFGTASKLQDYPCILATLSDTSDSGLAVASVRRENDTYIVVFLNKVATTGFNINVQFLVK